MTGEPNIKIVTRGGHPDFLDLPWGTPLVDWDDSRQVKMAHGMSRHIVRFVRYDDRVYALKETDLRSAVDEYDVLKDLREEHLPVVEPVGFVAGTPHEQAAVLITRYLDYSLPYWYLLGRPDAGLPNRLIDAGAVLLVRLHLEGVFWGDCSLSNILFRRDAGALAAYLVDAETTENHPSISDELRAYDLSIAEENIYGGMLELQAEGRVPEDVDPMSYTTALKSRYEALWDELTHTDAFGVDERWRIEKRLRRLADLGFDVEELRISRGGQELQITPVLIEEGHSSRELRRRTGLEVQENQARRLLSDISRYGAWLERQQDRPVPRAVAAARWLAEIYEPVVEAVPADLAQRLEPPELFHEMMEHRYYLSEKRGADVPNEEALADYLATILPKRPAERQLEASLGTESRY